MEDIKRYFITRIVAMILLIIISLCLLITRFVFKIYFIDPYYLICALITLSGLLAMSIASYRELCKHGGDINDHKEK